MAGHYTVSSGPTQRTTKLSGLGADFWSTITAGIQSASGILGARYAVPQLAPGQYMVQQTPQGMFATGTGSVAGNILPTNTGNLMTIGLIALLGFGALAMMGGRR